MRCDWTFLRILKYLGHESEEKLTATDGAVCQLKMSITKQLLKVVKRFVNVLLMFGDVYGFFEKLVEFFMNCL